MFFAGLAGRARRGVTQRWLGVLGVQELGHEGRVHAGRVDGEGAVYRRMSMCSS